MATHRICNANKFLALPTYTYVSYLLSINNICHMKEYAKWVKLWLVFSYISYKISELFTCIYILFCYEICN